MNTTSTAITALTYGQPVRHANWLNPSIAKVFTLRGYCAKNGSNYEAALARAIENGHEIVGAINTGACLHDSAALRAREDATFASATVLTEGQEVEIEGTRYTVAFVKGNTGTSPRHSDPIKFLPIA